MPVKVQTNEVALNEDLLAITRHMTFHDSIVTMSTARLEHVDDRVSLEMFVEKQVPRFPQSELTVRADKSGRVLSVE